MKICSVEHEHGIRCFYLLTSAVPIKTCLRDINEKRNKSFASLQALAEISQEALAKMQTDMEKKVQDEADISSINSKSSTQSKERGTSSVRQIRNIIPPTKSNKIIKYIAPFKTPFIITKKSRQLNHGACITK